MKGWAWFWAFLAVVNAVSSVRHLLNGRWGWMAFTTVLVMASIIISNYYYRKAPYER